MAAPFSFKDEDLTKLFVATHMSADASTRWFNALVGRLFLSVKDTAKMETYFRNKIVNKLSRIKRPSYLSEIDVQRIDCGDSVPFISNPKIGNLNREGELTVETNVSYDGGFSVVIATKANLNLMKFKPDVSLVLAVKVKKLEGKLIFKIRPPPSNRIWYAFEKPPLMNLSTEPIIGAKTVGFSYVTNIIENKIREVVKESLVMPSMDDMSFFNTEDDFYRGGIWDYSLLEKTVATEEKQAAEFEEEVEIDLNDDLSKGPKVTRSKTVPATLSVSSATELNEGVGNLRHRSRTSVSSVGDIDSDVVSELDLESEILGLSRGGDSPTSATASTPVIANEGANSSDFNISDHIGELKGFGYSSDGKIIQQQVPVEKKEGLSGAGLATKKFLTKTWNSWYSKDKQGKSQNSSASVSTGSDGSDAENTITPTASPSRNNPHKSSTIKLAPAPHEFPREFLSSIHDGTNPYGPAPEMRLPMTYPSPQTGQARRFSTSSNQEKIIPNVAPPTKVPKRKPVGGAASENSNDVNGSSDFDAGVDESSDSLRGSVSTLTGDATELPSNEDINYQDSAISSPPFPQIVVSSPSTLARSMSSISVTSSSDADSVLSNGTNSIGSRRMSSVSVKPSEPKQSSGGDSISFHPSPPTTVTTTISAITSASQHTYSASVPTSPRVLPSSAPIPTSPSFTNILQPTTVLPTLSPKSPVRRSNTVKRKAVGSAPSRPEHKSRSTKSFSSDDEVTLTVVKSESLPI